MSRLASDRGVVTRFAPSPTGWLHRGHAFSALTGWTLAQETGGRFLVRIEDIDVTRCRPLFEAGIFEDLAWLGLDWERPVLRQSQRMDLYRAALARLDARGLLYRCFRTRAELLAGMASAPHGPATQGAVERPGPAPLAEEARRLAAGEPFAWRLDATKAIAALGGPQILAFEERGAGPDGETGQIAPDPDLLGDVVLARKDLGVSYHLAVTVDDAAQGVTEVVRGEDLFSVTPIQRLIQALLELPAPAYRHHRLIRGPDGARLAKRDASQTLRQLRAEGLTPADLRAALGFV